MKEEIYIDVLERELIKILDDPSLLYVNKMREFINALKCGGYINKKNKEGNTILHLECYNGNVKLVELLLEYGADIEACNALGYTPLQVACSKGNLDIVSILLEHGADITKHSFEGSTALQMACYSGYSEIVELLLDKGADAYECDQFGNDLFRMACLLEQFPIAKLLVDRGYYKDNDYENYTLQVSCICGNAEVTKYLIDKGIDATRRDNVGNTLLHDVSGRGFHSLIKILIEGGIDVDAVNIYGNTALHLACYNNNPESVKELINNGASLQKINIYGCTPGMAASSKGYIAVLKVLIDAGIDKDSIELGGYNLLHIACTQEHIKVAQFLLNIGADVNMPDKFGYAPIHLTCDRGYKLFMNFLIRNGADVNKTTTKGWTPLHIACDRGYEDIVRLLLNSNADVNIVNNDGHTPLHLVCSKGDMGVLECMLEHKPIDVTEVIGEKFKDKVMRRLGSRALEDLYEACTKGEIGLVEKLIKLARYNVYNHLSELINVSTEDIVKYIVDKYGISVIGKVYNKINPDKHKIIIDKIFMKRGVLQGARGCIKIALEDKISKELMGACESGDYDYVVKLLETGIDVTKNVSYIELASKNNRYDIVKLFGNREIKRTEINNIQKHKEVEIQKSDLLMHAIKVGSRKHIKKLLRGGINVNSVGDGKGRTALMFAIEKGDEGTALDLIEMKANINAVDKSGKCVLMYAIVNDNINLINRLLNNQVNLDIKDNKGRSVLMYALKKGESMSCLIDGMINEDNINYKDKNGASILMYACSGGYMKAIVDIVEKGADIDAVDYNGNTALGIVFSKNNKEAMRYLIMSGATNPGNIENKNEIYKLIGKVEKGEILESELYEKSEQVESSDKRVIRGRKNSFGGSIPRICNSSRRKSITNMHK